jgi:hypothetical protein
MMALIKWLIGKAILLSKEHDLLCKLLSDLRVIDFRTEKQ